MSDPALDELAVVVLERAVKAGEGRALVGISGGVCVGKSTLAGELADALARRGIVPAVLCTDAFLLPNDELDDRGLTFRKGYPETFDVVSLEQTLLAVRRGAVEVPVYSHDTYDIVSGETAVVDGDVVIVEGVNVLQDPAHRHLDLRIYIDAAEPHVRRWFVQRFFTLRDRGRAEPSSFYGAMAQLDDPALEGMAHGVWEAVNAPNLAEHIGPTRARADLVVEKGPDHRIVRIVSP